MMKGKKFPITRFFVILLAVVLIVGFFPSNTSAQKGRSSSLFGSPSPSSGSGASWCGDVTGNAADKIADTLKNPVATAVRVVLCPVEILGYVLKILASIAFAISAFMFSFILNLNFEILNPSSITYKFISTGWAIVRDVANLGFVLFIILIALATIVRYRDYEAKKLLPRLIGAAILVNFSLAIPTVFINFSNIISNYFFSFKKTEQCKTLGENNIFSRTCDLTMHMASTLQPQKYIITPQFNDADVANVVAGIDNDVLKGVLGVASQYLGTLFISVGVFVMICYAILFLIRFVALHILLVLAPITWLFWVIPSTQGMFQKWWHKFFQYVFFAPAAIFFLYLVIYAGKGINAVTAKADPTPYLGFQNLSGDMLMSYVRTSAITLVMFAFLIGGLIAAQSLSIHGASGMVGFAKGAGKKARQWAQERTVEGGKAAVASGKGRELASRLANAGKNSKFKMLYKPFNKVGAWGMKTGETYGGAKVKEAETRLPTDYELQAKSYQAETTPGKEVVVRNVSDEYSKHHKAKEAVDLEQTKHKEKQDRFKVQYEKDTKKWDDAINRDDASVAIYDKRIKALQVKVNAGNATPQDEADLAETQSSLNEALVRIDDTKEKIVDRDEKSKALELEEKLLEKRSTYADNNLKAFQDRVMGQLPAEIEAAIVQAGGKLPSILAKGDWGGKLNPAKGMQAVTPERINETGLDRMKQQMKDRGEKEKTEKDKLADMQAAPQMHSSDSMDRQKKIVEKMGDDIKELTNTLNRFTAKEAEVQNLRIKLKSSVEPAAVKKRSEFRLKKAEEELKEMEQWSPFRTQLKPGKFPEE